MADATDNKTKLAAAVARWIGEAKGRPDGARLLRLRAGWVADQVGLLNERCPPAHLRGLTVWDLQDAQYQLARAARGEAPLPARRRVATIAFGHFHDGRIVWFGNEIDRPETLAPHGTLPAGTPDGAEFTDRRGDARILRMMVATQAEAA